EQSFPFSSGNRAHEALNSLFWDKAACTRSFQNRLRTASARAPDPLRGERPLEVFDAVDVALPRVVLAHARKADPHAQHPAVDRHLVAVQEGGLRSREESHHPGDVLRTWEAAAGDHGP